MTEMLTITVCHWEKKEKKKREHSSLQINHYSVSPVTSLMVLVTTYSPETAHKATTLLATWVKAIKV